MRFLIPALLLLPPAALAQTTETAGAGDAGAQAQGMSSCLGGGGIEGLIPIVGMIAIFYFLILRPQQKQQKELRRMRDNLKKDDRVVTSGGMHGVVVGVKGEIITLRIADGVKADFDRSAMVSIQKSQEGEGS
jgi:preprotein translocase subunit YajC